MRLSYNPLWQNWSQQRRAHRFVSKEMDLLLQAEEEELGSDIILCPEHYSFDGDHFATTKVYEASAAGAQAIKDAGMAAATEAYIDAQAGIGTPEHIIEKYRHRMSVMGPCHPAGAFFYGGMTTREADRSTRLFASEVVPELRKLFDEASAARSPEPAQAR